MMNEKDFMDQLELKLEWELTGAVIGNYWWGKIKDRFRVLLPTIAEDSNKKD